MIQGMDRNIQPKVFQTLVTFVVITAVSHGTFSLVLDYNTYEGGSKSAIV